MFWLGNTHFATIMDHSTPTSVVDHYLLRYRMCRLKPQLTCSTSSAADLNLSNDDWSNHNLPARG